MSKKFILQIILFSFIILIIGGTFYYLNRDKKNNQELSGIETEKNQNKESKKNIMLQLISKIYQTEITSIKSCWDNFFPLCGSKRGKSKIMTALSALNTIHKTGLFGNCQNKEKSECFYH